MNPIRVSPSAISYRSESRFIPEDRYVGKILDGDWDSHRVKLTETEVYKGLVERFHEGKSWTETAYYRHGRDRIESDGEFFGYTTSEEFLQKRCEYVDELYLDMKQNGYQSDQRDPVTDPRRPWSTRDPTGVSVLIGRDGELLLHDGHHRVVIARILNIDSIPVHVLIRHKEWQRHRAAVAMDGTADGEPHPDLHDVL
ncbi:ParB N-terminal domain-containing protein [Halorubrum vacuolatum]|uniref:hypothetical protein n=1 Tax=Halorubrum vacuolatum TaxID=63740 RepID=UPI000B77D48E|nr:hypothetical protein [Halorubrum vacuolatum]